MVDPRKITALVAVVLTLAIAGCADPITGEAGEGSHNEGGTEGGEESGTQLALDETYDQVRNGARLILNFDAKSNSFNGTVENTTTATLTQVRVEVHLNNGVELGPTTPADLAPGETRNISLPAGTTGFDRWSAHPEVG